jgi:hypothetical protein
MGHIINLSVNSFLFVTNIEDLEPAQEETTTNESRKHTKLAEVWTTWKASQYCRQHSSLCTTYARVLFALQESTASTG